jgi:GTPase SAR1 family protein
VGKTALTIRFERGQFIEDYDPTIEGRFSSDHFPRFSSLALHGIETHRKQVVVDDEAALIDIFDAAREEVYV